MKFLLSLTILLLQITAFAVPEKGHKLMVAAPTHRAIEVAQTVIKQGGNVVDVAVAVELTLAVTSPYYGSLGGGGFAMVKMGKEVKALDFRETAPIMTHPNFYINKGEKASTVGGLAVGIPGISAGLWELHKKYGKISWKNLFTEPIKLAKYGFPVSGDWVRITEDAKSEFNKAGIKYFFKADGSSYKPGELLRQPQLAAALTLLKDQGPTAFYTDAIAKDIVSSLKENSGVMAMADLKNYKVRWLNPMTKDYLGHTIYMMPPPSSSGVVTSSIISLIEQVDLNKKTPQSADEYHYLAEVLKMAFRGRALLGDPDFHKNPISFLTGKDYNRTLAKKISSSKATKLEPLSDKEVTKESNETTNFTVMDVDGNTVVMTVTLNGNYGSKMVSNKYGIALNNEMDDFTTVPNKPNMFGLIQGKGNFVEAGKRPLSSMSPTIITKDDKTVMGIGGSGGPRIITSVFQGWYRVIANNYDMDRAIQTPRVHHQFLPHTLYVDEVGFSPDTAELLKKKGHEVEFSHMGRINGVLLNKDGILEAAHDSRVEGSAGGL